MLPQGRFNNTSDKEIIKYIVDRARILAVVVRVHSNTFKPHTCTKTSVLFLQKWNDELCPKVDDCRIFFATSEKSEKDNLGDYVFLKKEDGEKK